MKLRTRKKTTVTSFDNFSLRSLGPGFWHSLDSTVASLRALPLSAFCLCLLLFSCRGPEPQGQGQFRLNLQGEPLTLDPRKGGDLSSSYIHLFLFEGITRLNHDRSLSLAQAKSVQISEDKLTYTFKMRGTFWSNGDPVTSYDFAEAWRNILNPSFPAANAHLLYPIRHAVEVKRGDLPLSALGIQTPDAETLLITLEQPIPYFLELISFCVFFPVHHVIDSQNGEWAYNAGPLFISNGPYVLDQWKHHDRLVMNKNPLYWNKEFPRAESLQFSMVGSEATALHMFENHELDMLGHPLSPIPTEALPALAKQGMLRSYPAPGTTIIAFNTQLFPFHNEHIRQAFSYAINREEIVTNITQLGEEIATGAVPPSLLKGPAHSFFIDHDIVKARELLTLGLQEIGASLQDLQEIVYYYYAGDQNHKIAQAIQQQWAKNLGLLVHLQGLEHKTLIEHLMHRTFSLAQNLWVAQYNDPTSILERFKFRTNPKNYAHWENPEFIRLLNASSLQTGKEREHTLYLAEQLFIEQMPIAPIFHWKFAYMVQPEISNLRVSASGDICFETAIPATLR